MNATNHLSPMFGVLAAVIASAGLIQHTHRVCAEPPAATAPGPNTQPPPNAQAAPASAPAPSQTPPPSAAKPTSRSAPAVPATAPPGQSPQSTAGQPTTSAAVQSAPAAPASAPKPIVSGGGDGPHGALPMNRQLAQLAGWIGAEPKLNRPAWVNPNYWSALLPKDNPQPSAAQVALGRSLYFEPKLSRDGSVACATCHDTSRGFTDHRSLFEGVGESVGRRNVPTTLNALFLSTQFWDGRAETLEDQAKLPITNPIEMGSPSQEAAVAAIAGDAEYQKAFQAAFGHPVNFDDIARAIGAFERTLVFVNAPFDRFAQGDAKAISEEAQAGWALFNGKARCSACHQISSNNPVGSDGQFHNVGVSARHQDFEALAGKATTALAKDNSRGALDELALQTDLSELGRFVVTRNRADIGGFKTSQVRNIGVTAPYMHDGSMQTLWDVIDHYNKGGEANPYLDGGIEPLALSETEINQLVAFLFTLTDDRLADQNRAEWERQRQIAAKSRPFRDDDLATRKVLPFERRAQGQR